MNEWNFGKLQKNYTQNLTRCEIFNWKTDALCFLNPKYDALYFFNFKIGHIKEISIQNHAV